ncbi:FG-GAP-like repeat-containing protein [Streptomyces sp. NPDC046316]|uniref:FG-GAP-like repeat-containing protein n=1 Tax=Streptomyces sp. NPDC046316 TaxID=3154494 RepID=UPI0033DE9933
MADGNGSGSMLKFSTDRSTLGTWAGKFSLVMNRTSKLACLYEKPNYDVSASYTYVESGSLLSLSEGRNIQSVRFAASLQDCEPPPPPPPFPHWTTADTSPHLSGFGDMNADRRADVLVRDPAGRLWFLPGDQTGRIIGTGGWNAFNALVRHGDFSGDGREDVIAREAATGKLWLYPGNGTGGLVARRLIGSGGWNGMSQIAAVGDLSGDNRSDLIAVEKATGRLWLYPGSGTGALGARTLIGNGGWNGINALVGVGDMNGDGRPDLYAREAATGKLWLYPGKAGSLGSRILVGSGGWNNVRFIVAVGDWSADGRPDLLAVYNDDRFYQYKGLGTGGIGPGYMTNNWPARNGTF